MNRRGRPKKRPNRYNPNAPDWKAVHAPWARPAAPSRGDPAPLFLLALVDAMNSAAWRKHP